MGEVVFQFEVNLRPSFKLHQVDLALVAEHQQQVEVVIVFKLDNHPLFLLHSPSRKLQLQSSFNSQGVVAALPQHLLVGEVGEGLGTLAEGCLRDGPETLVEEGVEGGEVVAAVVAHLTETVLPHHHAHPHLTVIEAPHHFLHSHPLPVTEVLPL